MKTWKHPSLTLEPPAYAGMHQLAVRLYERSVDFQLRAATMKAEGDSLRAAAHDLLSMLEGEIISYQNEHKLREDVVTFRLSPEAEDESA